MLDGVERYRRVNFAGVAHMVGSSGRRGRTHERKAAPGIARNNQLGGCEVMREAKLDPWIGRAADPNDTTWRRIVGAVQGMVVSINTKRSAKLTFPRNAAQGPGSAAVHHVDADAPPHAAPLG